MSSIWNDAVYALRGFRRTPLFTVVADVIPQSFVTKKPRMNPMNSEATLQTVSPEFDRRSLSHCATIE